MPETKSLAVKNLALDLRNYRTIPQLSEESALAAMVSTSPDRFWALTESLLRDGYLPTESIIVLHSGRGSRSLTVKEGNRRIAALKLIHRLFPSNVVDVPDNIAAQIKELPKEWRKNNATVPCTIYPASDAATVDRIVTLAHGKGEKAGRDQWNAIARARHNRDVNLLSEPALDLLEKYLQQGLNITAQQKARWAGNYPLTVLAEAMKRLAPRIGAVSAPVLARDYPVVKHRDSLEAILRDIGQDRLGFESIRLKEVDFASAYGVPAATSKPASKGAGSSPSGGTAGTTAASGKAKSRVHPKALAITDPKTVRALLKDFEPKGKKREKVVTLRNEATKLDVVKTPLAFCFVLRSMFEISAKVFCAEHGLSVTKAGGQDKQLVDVLRTVTTHLTKGQADKEMVKALHGAMTELAKSNGLLSVTSMNQLVHNPRFSIVPGDIAILFGNVFPLLEQMN